MGVLPDWMIREQVKIEPFAEGEKRPGVISYGLSSYGYDARLGYKFKVMTPHKCTGAIMDPLEVDPNAFETLDYAPDDFKGPHVWGVDGSVINSQGSYITYKCNRCGKVEKSGDTHDGPCVIHKPDHILIPPHSFVLGETLETFTIPRDVLCIVLGKSTYARCGIIVNVTPGEPEWTGKWTVEISNTGPLPAKVRCGQGIMQCIFLRSDGLSTALFDTVRRLVGQESQVNHRLHGHSRAALLAKFERLLHHDVSRSSCKTSYKDKQGKYQNQEGLTLPKVD